MFEKIRLFLIGELQKVVFTLIIIVLTFILLLVVGVVVGKYIKKKRDKRKRTATLAKLMQSIFRYIVIILAIIMILGVWGVDVAPLLAGAGIFGLIIGLGAQSLIRDLLAGISIVFENYFDIDDIVEIKGYKGRVIEIGLKSTKVLGWNGDVKIFTNGDIVEVTNFSKYPTVAYVDVEISGRHSIEGVISLLEEHLNDLRSIYSQIIEGPNVIGVMAVGATGSVLRITVKTLSEEHYAVERGIRKFVKELFERHDIEFSMPRVVLHSDKNFKI